jgi:hypothetical protein
MAYIGTPPINPVNGGTGIANANTKTITLGGALTTSGAFDSTFTMTNTTNVTFPTSGTLSTTTGTVTAVSVSTANGFAGSSSGGATPALTLSTSQTGLLSGNGTAITGTAITQHGVLVAGASNIVSTVPPGSSGNLLKSDGTDWTSASPASSGASVLLTQFQTQTNVATIDFTTGTLSGITPIMITLNGIVPLTGTPDFQFQVSTDAGLTWKATSYNTGINHNAVNSTTLSNGTLTTAAILGKVLSGISTYNATIWIENIVGNTAYYHGTATWYDGSVYRFGYMGGNLGFASVNGFRFLMSSGNITGNIGIYTYRTS